VDAEERARHDRLYAATEPVVDAAVRAGWAGDVPGIDRALAWAVHLGEAEAFFAAAMLASVATAGLRLPPGADGFMPVVVRGGRPVDPDAPENAALAFVGRFMAAAHAKDEGAVGRRVRSDARPGRDDRGARGVRHGVAAAGQGRDRRARAREAAPAAHPPASPRPAQTSATQLRPLIQRTSHDTRSIRIMSNTRLDRGAETIATMRAEPEFAALEPVVQHLTGRLAEIAPELEQPTVGAAWMILAETLAPLLQQGLPPHAAVNVAQLAGQLLYTGSETRLKTPCPVVHPSGRRCKFVASGATDSLVDAMMQTHYGTYHTGLTWPPPASDALAGPKLDQVRQAAQERLDQQDSQFERFAELVAAAGGTVAEAVALQHWREAPDQDGD
jgi:hypothetical protein